MARKSNTEARRAEIVAALQRVMASQGYERATVVGIAREAGLTPGLIHYHFDSKQAILVALVNTLAEAAEVRLDAVMQAAADPDQRLCAYLDARLALGDGASPSAVAAWVVIGAEAVRQAEVREVYQRVVARELARLAGLLADCLAARQRESGPAGELAAALLALMEGAYQLACAAPGQLPVGYAASSARRFALSALDSPA
jgi:TetR/AcrR family transcriptional repressor of bet genes